MPDIAAQTIEKTRPWPLTSAARSKLIDDIARMREDLTSLTGQGLEEGIVRLPVALTERRLETLEEVLARAEIVDGIRCVAIGRRATLCEDGGDSMTYEIVLPGDGNPSKGCISADSPLGEAILGARPGDVVEVAAPAGRWSVTLVSID
jgi:transcription elongation GreA/GreB family factor